MNDQDLLACPFEQKQELLLLHLHLAGTYRELQQLDAALEHYKLTLQLTSSDTLLGYVAEAHWGIALIAYAQANKLPSNANTQVICKHTQLRIALEHAENARFLYRSIGEQLRAAAVTCQIAQIEQTLGNAEKVRSSLEEILTHWHTIFAEPIATQPTEKRRQQETASIVSAAACTLAAIELDAGNSTQALISVDQALEAGKRSYKLRRADAYLMRGRILETIDPRDPDAEESFRAANDELADTHRIAARISAHVRFGRYLLKIGKAEEGEQELEQARLLSDLVSESNNTSTSAEDIPLTEVL